MYKHIEDYVFCGRGYRFPVIVTETNEAKRWWVNSNIRQFMDKPIDEQIPFLQEVFSQKRLKNFDGAQVHWKDWPEDYEVYEGIMYKLAINEDLFFIKDIAILFDDSVRVTSPLYVSKTAMEELRDIEINLAFSQNKEGIKMLLENLKNVSDKGYQCGNKEVIKTLLKRKYYETFKECIPIISDETKEIIRKTVEDISDKRLQKQVNEVISLLNY